MIVFISGGARSGKSSFAENYALSHYQKKRLVDKNASVIYVATAIRSDSEMEERILQHIQSRSLLWNTIEAPFDLYPVFAQCKKGDVILLDCLTIWVSNQLYERHIQPLKILDTFFEVIKLAKQKEIDLLVVSNDVNEGMPLHSPLVHQYIYTLEKIHMELIYHADEAIQVVAGIPLYWKGEEK